MGPSDITGKPAEELLARTAEIIHRLKNRLQEQLGFADTPWCVLALGDPLHPDSFSLREEARERLRTELLEKGVPLREFVWVWDSLNQAQVVIGHFPTPSRAERFARHLRDKGLRIRVAHVQSLPLTPL